MGNATVYRTHDGVKFTPAGSVDGSGCIYVPSLGEILTTAYTGVVRSDGTVWSDEAADKVNLCAWVDENGNIYNQQPSRDTVPVAHVSAYTGEVFRHPCSNDSRYRIGRVDMKGISVRQAAGAAAILLLDLKAPAVPENKVSPAPVMKTPAEKHDTEKMPDGMPPIVTGIITVISVVGVGFLYNYLFGLLFNYRSTVEKSVEVLSTVINGLNVLILAYAVYCFFKTIRSKPAHSLTPGAVILSLLAGTAGCIGWSAVWILIPAVLFNGEPDLKIPIICGFAFMALMLMVKYMEEGFLFSWQKKMSTRQEKKSSSN